jgi:hypothetical protein
VGGLMRDGSSYLPAEMNKDTKNAIELVDRGGHGGKFTGDVRQDHLWFLRTHKDENRHKRPPALGVREPNEVQTLDMKPFYLALMSQDVEKRLQSIADNQTLVGCRSLDFLDLLAVNRIAQLHDLNERADKLLPFVFKLHELASMRVPIHSAGKYFIECGPVAGDKLLPLYHTIPLPQRTRCGIISFWSSLRYENAEPLMIQLLETEEQFWEMQRLPQQNWRFDAPDMATERLRYQSYERINYAINCLNTIGHEAQCGEVLRKIWKRWHLIEPTSEIRETCRAAFRQIQARDAEAAKVEKNDALLSTGSSSVNTAQKN